MFDLRTTKWKVFETEEVTEEMDRNSEEYLSNLELRLEEDKGIIFPVNDKTLTLVCKPRVASFLKKKIPQLDYDITEDEASVSFPVDMLKEFGRQLYIIKEKKYSVDPAIVKERMAKAREARSKLLNQVHSS